MKPTQIRNKQMANDLTPREPESVNDGFSGSLSSSLFRSNNYLRWDTKGWIDRDGLKPPSPLVVLAVDEALQKWKDNKPETIHDKPLPDPEQLNAAIPQSEWERDRLSGNLREPWEHVVIVLMVDPNTGKSYRYTAATTGAHIAYDELKEAVITMRALRGENVIPVVNLTERPWGTNWGMRKRPDFVIIGWKIVGGGAQAVPAKPPAPQLPGPTAGSVETPAAPSVAPSAAPPPISDPAQPYYQAKPKPPVKPANETLDAMGDVKPVTMGEFIKDEVPW
jgi:hypothetical protein